MKLDNKRTIFVGFAFMAICAFWQVYDGIIPLILKNTFGINDVLSGSVMAVDNILALVLLPLFGTLSDRTNSKIGRRMPYVIGGSLSAAAITILLPLANQIRSFALFVIALGAVLLAMATWRSPAVALMPDVTPKPLRSKGNAIINLMGTLGGILALVAIGVLVPGGESPSYWPVFIFIAVFMAVCLLVLLKTTNEPKLAEKMKIESANLGIEESAAESAGEAMPPAVKKSFIFILASIFLWFMGYNAVITAFSKYANVYWGLEGGAYAYTLIVAQAAAAISYIPVGMIATRVGRRKTILGGIVLLAAAFGSAAFFKSFSMMMFFFFSLAGIGWASINVNSYPMVVEMSKGADVGKYTGYYYTVSMTAQIITPIFSGALLEYGYRILGSTDANAGYVLLFPYGAVFVALSFLTMLFVRHGDANVAHKQSALEHFDFDD